MNESKIEKSENNIIQEKSLFEFIKELFKDTFVFITKMTGFNSLQTFVNQRKLHEDLTNPDPVPICPVYTTSTSSESKTDVILEKC